MSIIEIKKRAADDDDDDDDGCTLESSVLIIYLQGSLDCC